MTWRIDYTSRVRADLIGLDPEVADTITDLLVAWTVEGPQKGGERVVGGMTIYEHVVEDRYLLGYMVDEQRQSLVLLWLRDRPVAQVNV